MELKTYKNKMLMSLLQRKIDQKAYFRTSKIQMHFNVKLIKKRILEHVT